MIYRTTTHTALTSILQNKTRSFLTTLGVIIGVLSVILLTSIGNGLTVYIERQFEALGSNLLIVAPGEIVSDEGGFNQESAALSLASSKLTVQDARSLARVGSPLGAVSPVIEGTTELRSRQGKKSGFLVAADSSYSDLRNTKPERGRFFSDSDVTGGRKVVMIGSKVASKLYAGEDPLGQAISINSVKFEIIGVSEPKSSGNLGGPDIDSAVYIPYTTAQKSLSFDKISYLLVQVDDKEHMGLAKARVKNVLSKRLKEDEFSVTDQSEILKTIQSILSTLTIGLSGIAAISLIVGGIGIMNIMLVTVSERTREIGLRKALGATPANILTQFLIESTTLSTLGGLIGIVLGLLGTLGIQAFFPASADLGSITLAFGVSLVTGIVFGVFPARRAARLAPIEALRYE